MLAIVRIEAGDKAESLRFKRGRGCSHCNGTGYQGRIGIFEFLEMDANLVNAMHSGDPSAFATAAKKQAGVPESAPQRGHPRGPGHHHHGSGRARHLRHGGLIFLCQDERSRATFMPLYQYRGRNQRGEAVKGQLEANSPDAVATQLFNSGVTPIDINLTKTTQDIFAMLSARFGSGGKIDLVDLILFCRQMYTLMKAGVPIMQALRGLRESTQNPAFARVIQSISESLDTGLEFSTALKRHGKVFPPLFVSMVQVGESTGSLEEVFQQLAIYLDREKDTRDRIKSALRYPIFVIVAMVVALAVINLFVIPAFVKVFTSFRIELPWSTKILIAMSKFTVAYWHIILIAMVGAFLGRAAMFEQQTVVTIGTV